MIGHELIQREIPQRAGLVYLVDNCDWPDEKNETVRLTGLRLDRERVLTERDRLPLAGQPVLDQQGSYRRSDDVRLSHVSHPEQQVVLSVSFADDRLVTEHDRLRSSFRARNLREYDASYQRLDEKSDARLHHHDEDGEGAFGGDDAVPVPDRHLCLDAEQYGRRVVVHVVNARLACVVTGGLVHRVPVHDGDQVPDQAEGAVGDQEGGSEHDQVVAPLHVDQRREYVDQVLPFPLQDVAVGDVAFAVLENEPTLLSSGDEFADFPGHRFDVAIGSDRKRGRGREAASAHLRDQAQFPSLLDVVSAGPLVWPHPHSQAPR